MLETSSSKTFSGVRFVLIGFGPIDEAKLRSKLVNGGGVDVGQYSQNCTHVIVDKLLYDDPICVDARNSGKTVVMGSWVDHSFDIGMPDDTSSVLYRPPKDLNGIPGAESLIVCLTGYQRQDRDEIMTMVALMGAQFSKPLVANKVTHLICYKFEGEKYELAKRMKRIKLVNHRWLEDCLRDWKLLPEADYEKSSYELEMMEASAKDSEDEAEEASAKQSVGQNVNKSPLGLRVGIPVGGNKPKLVEPEVSVIQTNSGISRDSANCDTSKAEWLTPGKVDRPHEPLAFDDIDAPQQTYCQKTSTFQDASCNALPDPLEKTPESKKVENDLMSISKSAEKFSLSAMKSSPLSYSRGTPKESSATKLLGEASSSLNGSLGMSKTTTASDVSASKMESAKERNGSLEDPHEIDKLHDKESPGMLPQKRSIGGSIGSSKSLKLGLANEAGGIPPASFLMQEPEPTLPEQNPSSLLSLGDPIEGGKVTHKLADSVPATKLPSSSEFPTKDATPPLENVTSKAALNEIVGEKTPERSLTEPEIGKSSTVSSLSLLGEKDKPAAEQSKKTASRKTLGTRKKVENTSNQKGSLYLSNTAASKGCMSRGNVDAPIQEQENDSQTEIPIPAVNFEVMQENENQIESEVEASKKTNVAEVVTNASEGKDRHDFEHVVNQDRLNETKIAHEADLEREANLRGPSLEDSSNRDSPDDATPLEEDKSNTRLKKALASGEKPRLDKGKKRDLPAVKAGKLNVKRTKMSRRDMPEEEIPKRNDADVKDIGRKTLEEENGKINVKKTESSKRDMPVEVIPKGNGFEVKHTERKTVEEKENRKLNVKKAKKSKRDMPEEEIRKGNDSEVNDRERKNVEEEDGKPNVKKTKKSKRDLPQEETPKGDDAEVKDMEKKTVEGKENLLFSSGDQKSSMVKPLARGEAAKSAKRSKHADKKSGKIRSKTMAGRKVLHNIGEEPRWFIVSGHRLQRKEYQQIIRRLKGKCCRDAHQWSYQATHFIATEVRRTEKFFAAAASGCWILKSDYLAACNQAGKFLAEEPYEWHKTGLSQDGAINFEAPRKWRLLREKTGHGAFYGMRIVIYGDCIVPSLDTIKRAVKAGDGTILATSPPYTRFLNSNTDFAIISPGMPRVDIWVQEFLRHEIPCVLADYLVEYVCKPGYALDKHVLYNTNSWAERSFNKLQRSAEEVAEEGLATPEDSSKEDDVACVVCGSRERGEVMLICGDEDGSTGCGVGTHVDCCDPPLTQVPAEDWFCPKCSVNRNRTENPPDKNIGNGPSSR